MTENVWQGIFWNPGMLIGIGGMDHIILDWLPERVCSYLSELPPDDFHSDPVFLIAGACLDLRRNGYAEKADGLMAAAKARWPEFRWDVVEGVNAIHMKYLPPVGMRIVSREAVALIHTSLELVSAIARGAQPSPTDPV